MKISTFAGVLLLLIAGGFLGVVYLVAHASLSRDELYALALLVGGGLLLLDPGDMRALLTSVIDRLPWGRKDT